MINNEIDNLKKEIRDLLNVKNDLNHKTKDNKLQNITKKYLPKRFFVRKNRRITNSKSNS